MRPRVFVLLVLSLSLLQAPGVAFTQDQLDQHVAALKPTLPAGFTLVIQDPWIVIGNDTPDRVRAFATGTVRWATEKLKQNYFTKDPEQIIDIWLFKDDAGYRKYARELFHDEPTTPYGYYSDAHHALIMNIGTGGGTLVHEMVHPFIRTNFTDCPTWFNEGLGSLYEQSAERDGHIVGLTNWRLKGLQDAIRKRALPSFKDLAATSPADFYASDRGNNYAQARYLCYYLQEKGLLLGFYRDFRDNVKNDPTGYNTLVRVLDQKDMAAFQKRWEDFVLKLAFP